MQKLEVQGVCPEGHNVCEGRLDHCCENLLKAFSGAATGTPCSCVMDEDGGWVKESLIPISVDFPMFSSLLSTCRTKSLTDHNICCVVGRCVCEGFRFSVLFRFLAVLSLYT